MAAAKLRRSARVGTAGERATKLAVEAVSGAVAITEASADL